MGSMPPAGHRRPSTGARLAISTAVVSLAAGGTWLGVSPDSPLRTDPVPSTSSVADAGTPTINVTVVNPFLIDGIATTADIYEARGQQIPGNFAASPFEVGAPLMVVSEMDPGPDDPGSWWLTAAFGRDTIERTIDCMEAPELAAEGTAVWACDLGPAPLETGRYSVVVGADEPLGGTDIEVIPAGAPVITVDPLPMTPPGDPLVFGGTISNRTRVPLPFGGIGIPGLGACLTADLWGEGPPMHWEVLLPGETRGWICPAGSAPADPDTYGYDIHLMAFDDSQPAATTSIDVVVGYPIGIGGKLYCGGYATGHVDYNDSTYIGTEPFTFVLGEGGGGLYGELSIIGWYAGSPPKTRGPDTVGPGSFEFEFAGRVDHTFIAVSITDTGCRGRAWTGTNSACDTCEATFEGRLLTIEEFEAITFNNDWSVLDR